MNHVLEFADAHVGGAAVRGLDRVPEGHFEACPRALPPVFPVCDGPTALSSHDDAHQREREEGTVHNDELWAPVLAGHLRSIRRPGMGPRCSA